MCICVWCKADGVGSRAAAAPLAFWHTRRLAEPFSDSKPVPDAYPLPNADADAVAEAERSVMIWFREWVDGGMFSAVTLAE